MLTYVPEGTTWHTAPDGWTQLTVSSQMTRLRSTQRSGGGGTSSSSAGTTRSETTIINLSTASTHDQRTTAFNGAGGTTNSSTQATEGDTSSSYTDNHTSSSGLRTRFTALTESTTQVSSLDFPLSTSTQSSTTRTTRTWPSTVTGTTVTGTEPETGTTSTVLLLTAVSSSGSGTFPTISTSSSYTSGETLTRQKTTLTGTSTTTQSSTTTRHIFLEYQDTVVFPNASGGPLHGDAIVWSPHRSNTTSTIALFSQLFSSVASGSAGSSIEHYSKIVSESTSWRFYSLSTSSHTTTSTNTASTSTTTTGAETSTSVSTSETNTTGVTASFLDGVAWNSNEAKSTNSLFFGTVTASVAVTFGEGEDTFTVKGHTFTSQSTGYDESLQFTTSEITETYFGAVSHPVVFNTWDRSYTTTVSESVPSSTTTIGFIASFSTNSQLLGTIATTLSVWDLAETRITITDWDERTIALLAGTLASTGVTTAAGGASTGETENQTLGVSYTRIDRTERSLSPSVQYQSNFELFRPARFAQRVMPNGFLGFGDGFETSSPVYAGFTSSIQEGAGMPGFQLIASGLPRFKLLPNASVFATGKCWLDGHPMLSGLSLSWLGSDHGSRTTASLSHRWESGTSSGTAIYVVSMTGPISGSFYSTDAPVFLHSHNNVLIPTEPTALTGRGAGPAGGIGPFPAEDQTWTFPPGAASWTWESADVTSSMSTSTSTGELVLNIGSDSVPIAFSYEEAMRLQWLENTSAQIVSALGRNLPEYPWTKDQDQVP
jgi:hypothetical protein